MQDYDLLHCSAEVTYADRKRWECDIKRIFRKLLERYAFTWLACEFCGSGAIFLPRYAAHRMSFALEPTVKKV